jgi:hypothetical protein
VELGPRHRIGESGVQSRPQFRLRLLAESLEIGYGNVMYLSVSNYTYFFVGEDTDLCSELLNESLEAMQMLPVATLFYQGNVSLVWHEIVERSSKFLRQVIVG